MNEVHALRFHVPADPLQPLPLLDGAGVASVDLMADDAVQVAAAAAAAAAATAAVSQGKDEHAPQPDKGPVEGVDHRHGLRFLEAEERDDGGLGVDWLSPLPPLDPSDLSVVVGGDVLHDRAAFSS